MMLRVGTVAVVLSSLPALVGSSQPTRKIRLTIPAGTPLRLYLTKRVPKRLNAPVGARLLDPLYVFDRQVAPAGATVLGHVSRVQPVPKQQRIHAMLNGDFTPLHRAEVEFTTLVLPGGRRVAIQTAESVRLNSVVSLNPSKKKKQKKQKARKPKKTGGVLARGEQTVRDKIDTQIDARTRGLAGIVRSPNKKERLYDFLMAKLPYHPQSVRAGTRFDAVLRAPLAFGSEAVPASELQLVGSQPPVASVVHTRLVTPLDSGTAKLAQPVEAIVVAPLFAPGHKLVLPEGTRLTGEVVVARKARWFHRGGRLRFNFERVELPPEMVRFEQQPKASPPMKTLATLAAAENTGKTPIKVDTEGDVQAKESKKRFIAPAIAVLIANKSMDNDAGRAARTGHGGGNVSGRSLGGASGFGLLGALAAQGSPYVGTALGFYGMAWSVYSNVIARGGEVAFDKNAALDIRFDTRKPAPGSKFRRDTVALARR